MSSTDNPPSLALSDIMHHMSPSPAPFEEQGSGENITEAASIGGGRLGRDASPEILNAVDVTPMRQRLEELGFSVARRRNGDQGLADLTNDNNTSSREKELLDMVIRLTEALPVDPAQLERQAGTIANLTTQRDFIALQAEEERARWRSERESWERSAEALLSQRNRQGKSEDSDRLRATLESENRVLREKLQDAHRRLSSLESELMRLKPMLLMQPYSTARPDKGKGREVDTRSQLEKIPEETETKDGQGKSQYYAHNYQAPPKITVNSPATASTSKATTQPSQNQSRRSKDRGSKSKRQMHPVSSDAYTEHMLLAAKRIGRKRAATVAGIIQHAEREKAALAQEQEQLRIQKEQDKLEQDRQERVANGSFGAYYRTPADGSTSSPQRGGAPRSGQPAPRTPKRTGIHYSNLSAGPSTSTNPIPINLDSPLVYVNVNPAASQHGSPWAGSGVMGTPGQIRSALNRETGRGSQKAGTSNPPTPLASLLDAALMMDDEGRGGIKARGKTNGKGRALEEPESPMPKRRKISSAGKQAASGSNMGNSLNRVKSALDVLADQAAAAVVEPDQSDKRASESGISNAAKGKGKAKEKPKNRRNVDEDELNQGDGNQDEFGLVRPKSTSVSSRGRARTRGSIGTSSRTKAKSTSVTVSSRPVRQASRKRANSSEHSGAPSTSVPSRGSGRARGRPKGSVNKTRPGGSGSDAGTSQMVSPLGPRVIAPPPGYSPLDEAMALSSSVQSKGKQLQRERSEEHAPQAPMVNRPMQINPKLGLRPVSGWGERKSFDVDSDSSPVRGSERPRLEDYEGVHQDMPTEERLEAASPAPVASGSTTGLLPPLSSIPGKSTDQIKSFTVNGRVQDEVSVSIPSDIGMISPSGDEDIDADAEADIDEDQDAEGEQEEDEDEDAEVEVSGSHHFRSRSPPPPDPPPPGSDNGPPPDEDDEHDPDADAEGEMEFEENEDAPSGPMSSSTRQTSKGALSTSEKPSTPKASRYPSYSSSSDHFFRNLLHSSANIVTSANPRFELEIPTAFFLPSWSSESEPFQIPSSSTPHPFASRPSFSHERDLSEKFEDLPLSTSYSILANASAKRKSKRGLQRSASQVLMLENAQHFVGWNKHDNQPSKVYTASDFQNPISSFGQPLFYLGIVWQQLRGATSFRKAFAHRATHSEPPFSTISPFIKPLLEVVS